MSLKVNEIFYSIQGESSYAGMPCVFVRLTGCNLRCSWCDTRYAYEEGDNLTIREILDRVRPFECGLVEITGGEPLLQTATPDLAKSLLSDNYTVLVETNGSLDIGLLDPACSRIVDMKCPSSGMFDCNDLRNLERLTRRDELKFVIGTREDYEFAVGILDSLRSNRGPLPCTVSLSPVFGAVPPRSLAEWILHDRLPVRLNLQLHKILWAPETRGV